MCSASCNILHHLATWSCHKKSLQDLETFCMYLRGKYNGCVCIICVYLPDIHLCRSRIHICIDLHFASFCNILPPCSKILLQELETFLMCLWDRWDGFKVVVCLYIPNIHTCRSQIRICVDLYIAPSCSLLQQLFATACWDAWYVSVRSIEWVCICYSSVSEVPGTDTCRSASCNIGYKILQQDLHKILTCFKSIHEIDKMVFVCVTRLDPPAVRV